MMRKTVLIVEDDADIREALTDTLEFDGYQVVTAIHGRDGLAKLREMPVADVILLDMSMPVMNGYEFLKEKKADPELASVPVVVISANAEAEKVVGADAFVRKPLDVEQLIQSIARLIH
jgi:CheY-like chemotaxis protein